ncbi:MAG: hypothetical protein NKF70_12350 [Methanobacterium sp. ERen5]|nr:MAG: hypothetical protein NKF70_12350 [Methanobacterium sp. ERen5]
MRRTCILNKSIIMLICFFMVMITPASANQIQTSMATHELKNPHINKHKVVPNLKILHPKKQNSKNTLKKVTLKKILSPLKSSKKSHCTKYSQLIACASKLQPVMEESYKNTINILKSLNKDQKNLKTQKNKNTRQMEKIKSQIDNYELTTNNTQCYKDLQNQYKNCSNSNKTLTITEASMKKLNLNLKKKQKHTKNCINALKSIKKAENIQASIKNYNQNMKSLKAIDNNMSADIQKSQEIIKQSNITNPELDKNVKDTNSYETYHNKVTNALKYTLIATGTVTGTAALVTSIPTIVFGLLAYKISVATRAQLLAVGMYGIELDNFAALGAAAGAADNIVNAGAVVDATFTATADTVGLIGIKTTFGYIAAGFAVVTVLLLIATCLVGLAYYGSKHNWF